MMSTIFSIYAWIDREIMGRETISSEQFAPIGVKKRDLMLKKDQMPTFLRVSSMIRFLDWSQIPEKLL